MEAASPRPEAHLPELNFGGHYFEDAEDEGSRLQQSDRVEGFALNSNLGEMLEFWWETSSVGEHFLSICSGTELN